MPTVQAAARSPVAPTCPASLPRPPEQGLEQPLRWQQPAMLLQQHRQHRPPAGRCRQRIIQQASQGARHTPPLGPRQQLVTALRLLPAGCCLLSLLRVAGSAVISREGLCRVHHSSLGTTGKLMTPEQV